MASLPPIEGTLGQETYTFDAGATRFDTNEIRFDQQGYLLVEPTDAAEFTGTASDVASGELLAAEATDEASLAGLVATVGAVDAVESADSVTMVGTVPIVTDVTVPVGGSAPYRPTSWGTLQAREAQDGAVFAGSLAADGALEASEEADDAQLGGGVVIVAQFGIAEPEDTAFAAGRVEDWIAYDNDFLLAA